jgi:hypothetical protein
MKFLFKSNGKINAAKLNQPYFEKHHSEELSNILKYAEANSLTGLNFSQKLYHYVNDLKTIPVCKHCGGIVQYKSYIDGYKLYCSRSCVAKSEDVKNKIKNGFMDKYGVDNPNKVKSVRDKIKSTNILKYGTEYGLSSPEVRDKINKTNNERYGGNSPSCSAEVIDRQRSTLRSNYGVDSPIKNETIKNKIKNTNRERYGVDNVYSSDEIKIKIKNTSIERYGVDHPGKNEHIKEKKKRTCIDKYGVENPSMSTNVSKKIRETHCNRSNDHVFQTYGLIVNGRNDVGEILISCDKCGREYSTTAALLYTRHSVGMTQCTLCNDPTVNKKSTAEYSISEYIKSITNAEVLNNVRNIIGGELDIYIPQLNIAFEYDGLYWHSELFKDKHYHLRKKMKCAELNINLIHIFEDEWIYHTDIVKSRISNLLGMTTNNINARSCDVVSVKHAEAAEFLVNNHIQGAVNSKINLALKYNGEIVSIMTFGARRKIMGAYNSPGEYEMLRFCNAKNTNVRGAASRLLAHFIKENNPTKITTYADYRWSSGAMYEKLGFRMIKTTEPNYWYVVQQMRKHRFSYRKDVLVKQGFNPNKSEFEIMLERKIYKIWDCGHLKFELDLSEKTS